LSRVNENQKKQQAEAERTQKRQDRAARDASKTDQSRQRFGEMVKKGAKQKQTQEHQMKNNAARQQGENVQGQANKQAQQSARNARMARGGVVQHQRLLDQTKSFQGTLKAHKGQTQETDKGRVDSRNEGMTQAREAVEERHTDLDTKKQDRADREQATSKAEGKAQARVNSAIDGRGGGGAQSGDGGHERGTHGAQVSAQASGGAAGAEGAQAHEVKQIPEEILKAIASEVYVGFNEKGLHEFRIELKEGVLQGGTLRVTSDGPGRVSLQFDGLSGHAKNLVSASHTELARRLSDKGLTLDDLKV
jgi:membrane protein involved in colicin uptake